MKRNLIGSLAVAGALTLWSGVSSFAATDSPKQIADKAIGTVTGTSTAKGCASTALDTLKELGKGAAATSLKGDEAKDLAELLSDASDDVIEIQADAVSDINDTLEEFMEELVEEPLAGAELTAATTEFQKEVDGIAKKACDKITKIIADVQKEFASLTTVKVENEDESDNDGDKDHRGELRKAGEAEHRGGDR